MPVGFSSMARKRSAVADPAPGRELPASIRKALPAGFEAVGEALVGGLDPTAACAEVGRAVARDGASLGEALDGLRATWTRVSGREPAFTAAHAMAVAWSEATLQYLHELTCDDPLTGLASLAHVRTRLAEIYREAQLTGAPVRATHALVVVQVQSRPGDPFGKALVLARVADALRAVFCGGDTTGRLGADRAVAVVRREPDLGTSVAVLRELLDDLRLDAAVLRVWIEGLPEVASSATRLLDELAR